MDVPYGTDHHVPEKPEEARGHYTIRNVGRNDARHVRTDDRNLERNQRVRKRVQVPARAAPGVRKAHVRAFPKTIMRGDVGLAIPGLSKILHRQQAISAAWRKNCVYQKKVHGVAVQIAGSKVQVLAKLMLEHQIPAEGART